MSIAELCEIVHSERHIPVKTQIWGADPLHIYSQYAGIHALLKTITGFCRAKKKKHTKRKGFALYGNLVTSIKQLQWINRIVWGC